MYKIVVNILEGVLIKSALLVSGDRQFHGQPPRGNRFGGWGSRFQYFNTTGYQEEISH